MPAAAAVAGLWAYRRYTTSRASPAPIGSIIDVDGVRLHYVERGHGAPVVLLHGNGANVADFIISGVFDRVARAHRTIAFDRPGFGDSARPRQRRWTPAAQAALLERAFARLDIERPIVVGHSWGALVALALAARNRIPLAGLVLIAGYYYPVRRIDVALVEPLAIPFIGAPLRALFRLLAGRRAAYWLVARAFAPCGIPARFARGFPIARSLRPSSLRASAEETVMMRPAAAALRKNYAKLAVPVTILAGAEDRLVETERHAARLRRDVPHSTLHMFAGLGHMLHHFVPEHVATAIERMGRRTP
jgi:pimeloyl-ACP methyl ester carboxylesterase